MIRGVTLTGFRGFEKVVAGPFERVSLILGRNNVGKTSLLEALFLLAGPTNPELPLRLGGLRGVESFRSDPDEMWGWLFYQKQSTRKIELSADLGGGKTRTLTITLVEPTGVRLAPKKRENRRFKPVLTAATVDPRRQLEMRYRDEKGATYVTSATLKDASLEYQRDQPLQLPNGIFVTGRSGYATENALRFSKLEEVGREGEMLPVLQQLEPRLKRLAVLVTGSGPVVHGDLGLGHMIPMHFMGEGIGRLLTILLAMAESPKGIVLIDEIEMGLHYSALVATWQAIAALAEQYDVQVVATTHNWECLRAANEVFGAREDPSFAIHRLERYKDTVRATQLTLPVMKLAIESGLEVR